MSIQRCCPVPTIFGQDLEGETALFKALGDPARVAILATLARNDHEICVCDFTDGLERNQSTISHHLKILKDAGLVTSVRRGTWGYYTLARDVRERLASALSLILPVGVGHCRSRVNKWSVQSGESTPRVRPDNSHNRAESEDILRELSI